MQYIPDKNLPMSSLPPLDPLLLVLFIIEPLSVGHKKKHPINSSSSKEKNFFLSFHKHNLHIFQKSERAFGILVYFCNRFFYYYCSLVHGQQINHILLLLSLIAVKKRMVGGWQPKSL